MKQYKVTIRGEYETKVFYITAQSILSADKLARIKYADLLRYANSMDVENA